MPGGIGTDCLYRASGDIFCIGDNKNICSSLPSHSLCTSSNQFSQNLMADERLFRCVSSLSWLCELSPCSIAWLAPSHDCQSLIQACHTHKNVKRLSTGSQHVCGLHLSLTAHVVEACVNSLFTHGRPEQVTTSHITDVADACVNSLFTGEATIFQTVSDGRSPLHASQLRPSQRWAWWALLSMSPSPSPHSP